VLEKFPSRFVGRCVELGDGKLGCPVDAGEQIKLLMAWMSSLL
jgi:hypothetical protein